MKRTAFRPALNAPCAYLNGLHHELIALRKAAIIRKSQDARKGENS
jgi:hypothetical protein